jgi:hypothetical protein
LNLWEEFLVKDSLKLSVENGGETRACGGINCFEATTIDQLVKQFRNFEPKKRKICRCKPALKRNKFHG